jgi:hypothetical protein
MQEIAYTSLGKILHYLAEQIKCPLQTVVSMPYTNKAHFYTCSTLFNHS